MFVKKLKKKTCVNLHEILRHVNESANSSVRAYNSLSNCKNFDWFQRSLRHRMVKRAKIARNNERHAPRNPLAPLVVAAVPVICESNTLFIDTKSIKLSYIC